MHLFQRQGASVCRARGEGEEGEEGGGGGGGGGDISKKECLFLRKIENKTKALVVLKSLQNLTDLFVFGLLKAEGWGVWGGSVTVGRCESTVHTLEDFVTQRLHKVRRHNIIIFNT